IPEPCNAVLNKLMVETSPPFSSLGTGEIRKDRRARPDDADKLASIGILHKMISRMACVVWRIALVRRVRNMQIGDGNDVKVLFAQIGNESGKLGKAFRVDRKGAGSILIVDVEIKNVGVNFVRD